MIDNIEGSENFWRSIGHVIWDEIQLSPEYTLEVATGLIYHKGYVYDNDNLGAGAFLILQINRDLSVSVVNYWSKGGSKTYDLTHETELKRLLADLKSILC